MSRPDRPFAAMPLETAIALRWSLRDIHAGRLKLTPLDPAHLDILLQMGLVALTDDQRPVLTEAGRAAIGDDESEQG